MHVVSFVGLAGVCVWLLGVALGNYSIEHLPFIPTNLGKLLIT
jgi:hypothetical protein